MDEIARSWTGDSWHRRDCVETYSFGGGRVAEVVTTYMLHYRDYPATLVSTKVDSVRHRFQGMDAAAQAEFLAALESGDGIRMDALFGIYDPAKNLDADPLHATACCPAG